MEVQNAHQKLREWLASFRDLEDETVESLRQTRDLETSKAHALLNDLRNGNPQAWAEFLIEQMLLDEKHGTKFAQEYKRFSPFKQGALVRFRAKPSLHVVADMEGEVELYSEMIMSGSQIKLVTDYKRAGIRHSYFFAHP